MSRQPSRFQRSQLLKECCKTWVSQAHSTSVRAEDKLVHQFRARSTRTRIGRRSGSHGDIPITSACGEPLLVGVVAKLVGDTGYTQEPAIACPRQESGGSPRKDSGEAEQKRRGRVPTAHDRKRESRNDARHNPDDEHDWQRHRQRIVQSVPGQRASRQRSWAYLYRPSKNPLME
jgi:hypothetical protein